MSVLEVQELATLDGVIRWALTRTPCAEFREVIVQDEFTHDVVVRVSESVFLVFDTT